MIGISITVPGATCRTLAMDINALPQIFGTYIGASDVCGFVDTNGVIATPDAPGALATYATGINNSDAVVGFAQNETSVEGFLVPEPATLVIPGSGLLGLIVARRRSVDDQENI